MSTSTIELGSASARGTSGHVARYVAYPSVLLGNVALIAWASGRGVALAGVTLLGLFGTLAALFALERIVPHRRDWQPSWKEGLRDFFYFGMNGGIDALSKMGIAFGVAALGTWNNALPLWLALPLAILVADFSGYWLHRWGHQGWLWKVHGVHHTPDKVNTWNNNTIHFINTIYSGLSKTLPLMLLGFAPEVIVIAAYVATVQSFAVHANVDVCLGKLEHVLMTPVHHRLHHSTKLEQAGNFATVTTLWDRVFGTFVYAPDFAPAQVGVVEPKNFQCRTTCCETNFTRSSTRAAPSSWPRSAERMPRYSRSSSGVLQLLLPCQESPSHANAPVSVWHSSMAFWPRDGSPRPRCTRSPRSQHTSRGLGELDFDGSATLHRSLPMRRTLTLALSLGSLSACVDAAEPDLRRCEELETQGKFDEASQACRLAISQDPESKSGKLAEAKLPALMEKEVARLKEVLKNQHRKPNPAHLNVPDDPEAIEELRRKLEEKEKARNREGEN